MAGRRCFLKRSKDHNTLLLQTSSVRSNACVCALEVKNLDDVAGRIEELLNQAPPKTLMEKLSLLPKLFEFSKYLPEDSEKRSVSGGHRK